MFLDCSSMTLAASTDLKEQDRAEAVQQHWPLSVAAGRHQSSFPHGNQLQLNQTFYPVLRTGRHCVSLFFSPKGNQHWDFRWHLLTTWIQEIRLLQLFLSNKPFAGWRQDSRTAGQAKFDTVITIQQQSPASTEEILIDFICSRRRKTK